MGRHSKPGPGESFGEPAEPADSSRDDADHVDYDEGGEPDADTTAARRRVAWEGGHRSDGGRRGSKPLVQSHTSCRLLPAINQALASAQQRGLIERAGADVGGRLRASEEIAKPQTGVADEGGMAFHDDTPETAGERRDLRVVLPWDGRPVEEAACVATHAAPP